MEIIFCPSEISSDISLKFRSKDRLAMKLFGQDFAKFRSKIHDNKERNSPNFVCITFAQYCIAIWLQKSNTSILNMCVCVRMFLQVAARCPNHILIQRLTKHTCFACLCSRGIKNSSCLSKPVVYSESYM